MSTPHVFKYRELIGNTTLLCKYSLTPIIRNFAMKQKRKKDVVVIVSVDLIGLLPTNHIIYIIYKLWHIRFKSGKWMPYNIILFDGAYFLLAVMVVGDESSWLKMANKLAVLAGWWPYWQRCTSVEGMSWTGHARPVVCLLSVQIPTLQAQLQSLRTSPDGEAGLTVCKLLA